MSVVYLLLSNIYDLTSLGNLDKISVSGMISLLLSGSSILLDIHWPALQCLCISRYLAMLVIVVVYTCCGLSELFNWFLSLSLYIAFSSPMEATFQACHFQVRSISTSLSLMSQVCSVISNNNPPSTPGKNCLKGISDRLERKKNQ